MKILNKTGAILGIVLIFMLIFTILGYGLLNLSGTDAIETVKAIQATQAFWTAEAGIERAINRLPDNTDPLINEILGNGVYNVTVAPVSEYRWTIESTGSVNTATRTVQVVVGQDITTVVMTGGSFERKGAAEVTGDIETGTSPCFEDIFGIDKAEMEEIARDYYYYDSDSVFNNETVENITWVNGGGAESQITTSSWTGSGIFIVNGDLKITGGKFDGVIWVTGELCISGNPVITGAIFIEGDATVDTTVSGTAEIIFDSSVIDRTFGNLTSSDLLKPKVLSWQECL